MGIMVPSLLWVMQDSYHQPSDLAVFSAVPETLWSSFGRAEASSFLEQP